HPKAGLARHHVRLVTRSLLNQVVVEPPVVIDEIDRKNLRLKRGKLVDGWLQGDGHKLAVRFHLQRIVHRQIEIRDILMRIHHRREQNIDVVFSHSSPSFRPPSMFFPRPTLTPSNHQAATLETGRTCPYPYTCRTLLQG